jgi:hypothetical protein
MSCVLCIFFVFVCWCKDAITQSSLVSHFYFNHQKVSFNMLTLLKNSLQRLKLNISCHWFSNCVPQIFFVNTKYSSPSIKTWLIFQLEAAIIYNQKKPKFTTNSLKASRFKGF